MSEKSAASNKPQDVFQFSVHNTTNTSATGSICTPGRLNLRFQYVSQAPVVLPDMRWMFLKKCVVTLGKPRCSIPGRAALATACMRRTLCGVG